MIPFNIPVIPEDTKSYIDKVFAAKKFSGDGEITKLCNKWLEENCGTRKALLTTSCTHALEISAILSDIKEGDEVIMPSFTFVSTANAFVLRGARIVFVDIRPGDMNIDENLIEQAITKRTKAIVPMHYGGVACNMDVIMDIATKYGLKVIEDAAQGLGAYYNGKPLGSIGDLGTVSFHDTKNIHCGEGGALFINNEAYVDRGEIIREKGTDRSKFMRGLIDKYTWRDIGSSYLPSEFNAGILYPQLLEVKSITAKRVNLWNLYQKILLPLAGVITLPEVPDGCTHNGHVFYIRCKDIEERSSLISFLKNKGISAVYHYIPLHSAPAGLNFGVFSGVDKYTTKESERLLRLPMYFDLSAGEVEFICEQIFKFYS